MTKDAYKNISKVADLTVERVKLKNVENPNLVKPISRKEDVHLLRGVLNSVWEKMFDK